MAQLSADASPAPTLQPVAGHRLCIAAHAAMDLCEKENKRAAGTPGSFGTGTPGSVGPLPLLPFPVPSHTSTATVTATAAWYAVLVCRAASPESRAAAASVKRCRLSVPGFRAPGSGSPGCSPLGAGRVAMAALSGPWPRLGVAWLLGFGFPESPEAVPSVFDPFRTFELGSVRV